MTHIFFSHRTPPPSFPRLTAPMSWCYRSRWRRRAREQQRQHHRSPSHPPLAPRIATRVGIRFGAGPRALEASFQPSALQGSRTWTGAFLLKHAITVLSGSELARCTIRFPSSASNSTATRFCPPAFLRCKSNSHPITPFS